MRWEWVKSDLSIRDVARRTYLAHETGYFLVGGHSKSDPQWSYGEVCKIGNILSLLPPNLRDLNTLTFFRRRGLKCEFGALGSAHLETQSIEFPDLLVRGSHLPVGKLLSYNIVHEIGHHWLWSDKDLSNQWQQFFELQGHNEILEWKYVKAL